MSDLKSGNFYRELNYEPVVEEVTAFDLPVAGELPAELSGRYLRNGPNPVDQLNALGAHWFLGDGMVHGIRISDGKAEWYRNRYVGSSRIAQVRGEPDIAGPNWAGNPLGPNTNVGGFAGKTWAMVEAGGCPVELSYELESLRRNDFEGTLQGPFSAHPKLDPVSGELHAMTYCWPQLVDRAQYVVVGSDGKVRKTLDIPMGMTMLHDMSLTARYAVIYDQPCTVDLDLAFGGEAFPFRWNPDYGNRIGLLPRDGGVEDIIWIDVPNGYVFHPMNAFEAGPGPDDAVVLDLCMYDSMFDNDVDGPFRAGSPRLERWELNPSQRTVSISVIDERAIEFPRARGSLTGQPYRYGYAIDMVNATTDWATVKYDLHTGDRSVFDHGAGRAAGEAVFVARAGGSAEDDGWLLAFVHDSEAGKAEFVVLDAQDFDRGYVARVELPQRVPFGFHGNWVSDLSVAPD